MLRFEVIFTALSKTRWRETGFVYLVFFSFSLRAWGSNRQDTGTCSSEPLFCLMMRHQVFNPHWGHHHTVTPATNILILSRKYFWSQRPHESVLEIPPNPQTILSVYCLSMSYIALGNFSRHHCVRPGSPPAWEGWLVWIFCFGKSMPTNAQKQYRHVWHWQENSSLILMKMLDFDSFSKLFSIAKR